MARTGAVLLLLLAALLHVLDCAHGPNADPSGRADTLLLTPSASCTQTPEPAQRTTARQATPGQEGTAHCCGSDEPTLQPPRDVALALPATVHGTPAARHLGTPAPSAAAAPRHSWPVPDAASPGETQARLGVWRT
ncbi:hypothetical protein ACGF5O_14895 [Streptomyces sp. NPDC048291]|uniref:hypothetical protein n=1 Tax=Streptomyces sp. NPDC048291 TaxID=3365530 RepID=UPI00371C85AF